MSSPLQVSDVVAVLDALHLSKAHFWGYSMGGRIGFGMAKYAPARVHALIIGGAQPYGRHLPTSSRLDGTDPEAFATAFLARLGVNPETLPAEIREEFFANDFQALAAAEQDAPSLEDILPTMTMPCLLYIRENVVDIKSKRNGIWALKPRLLDSVDEPWRHVLSRTRHGFIHMQ